MFINDRLSRFFTPQKDSSHDVVQGKSNALVFSQWLLLFTLLTVALLLSGCSDAGDVNNADKQTDKKIIVPSQTELADPKNTQTIALVMKTLTNPFFIEMERGARRAEKELGINLLVKTAAQETSIQQQINIVGDLIRLKTDAIVIAPGDSVELIPVLKQAQDAGITVINIDNRLDPQYSKITKLAGVPFIGVDNEKAAYLLAKSLANQLIQPTSVAILEGIRGAANAEDRKNGAIRAFNEHSLATIVAMETANWKIDEALEVSKQLFVQHPEIGILFCANDMMALGAIEYLKSVGRSNVMVAGFDALMQAKVAVKAGTLTATVDQQAAEQGYQGVVYAVRALAGENLPLVTLVDTRIINNNSKL